ncbi:MAG: 4-alpha-glucanotransferase [Eubacteriales bacterium]|nr:4-alpha-glucanotransferase [Eubacteriales bacterium]
MTRAAGILLPIFSLPGPFGAGVFGDEAVELAKALQKAKIKEWLILPLNPPGAAFSPYAATSSFAGNPGFIDPRDLRRRGLLQQEELQALYVDHGQKIDYASFFQKQEEVLRLALGRLKAKDEQALEEFMEEESYWLQDYASFMTIRKFFHNLPWWEWPDKSLEQKNAFAVEEFIDEHQADYRYYCYEQYEFHRQWAEVRKKINDCEVSLIGDIPIYPAADSADLWGKRSIFETDEEGHLTRVAGVPPDYFSETGQLWGNPLYDWEKMAESDYAYWRHRIAKTLDFCDKLRIDHFRGFESYWAVPADETTAVEGTWEQGPAMDLFGPLLKYFPPHSIIAEDLGVVTEGVTAFLEASGLPGMKVLQFAFNPEDKDSVDRPHSYVPNCVAFTGTHDNDTLLGWARSLSSDHWDFVCTYLGIPADSRDPGQEGPHNPLCRRAILTLFQSVAQEVIIPVQDLLGLGTDFRINLPGSVSEQNWTIRLSQEQLAEIDFAWLAAIVGATQRDAEAD